MDHTSKTHNQKLHSKLQTTRERNKNLQRTNNTLVNIHLHMDKNQTKIKYLRI